MQDRSPAIFWLLVAATISVDAIASFWIIESQFDEESATLYLGLAFGQLSVLGAWAVLFRKRMAATWIIPFVAALLIALNTAYAVMMQDSRPSDWYDFYLFVALMWAHVAIVVPLLWLLKPTRLFAVFADQADQRRWQFSTGHLLVVMTCSAVLLVVLGKSGWLVDSNLASFGSLLIGNAILLVAIVVSTLSHWHWLLRLAASLAAAFIVAEVCELTDSAFASALNLVAYNLVQSMVVWSWLELIRPPRRDEVASDEKPKRLVPAP